MATGTIPEASRPAEVARLELSQLPADASLEAVFRRACELCADALEVQRVGVWLFIDENAALRCANLFERDKREHSSGALLWVCDFPNYFNSLQIRKAVPAEIALTEPWTVELAEMYLRPLGITSVLDAGIFVEGVMVGVLCHEHVGSAREWSTEARDLAGSIADLIAMRIQSGEVRQLREAFLTHQERQSAKEKSSAMEQFASGVAHDFRNLLTVFLGEGSLLLARTELPADVRRTAKVIVDAAERGAGLVQELLEFARRIDRPPAVIDLAAEIKAFLPMLQSTAGARHMLHFTQADSVGRVLLDKNQFTRLLLNLVVNACDAQPDGGPIEVRLAAIRLGDDQSHPSPYVLLEVVDFGVGMDEKTCNRIFEPFYSTKVRGTGLGLAIVRQIVERAGGFIRVDSAPGKGTAFRIFIPRIDSSADLSIRHSA